jgi:hypothetical protein
MKLNSFQPLLLGALLFMAATTFSHAQSSFIFDIAQDGNNVVATGSGTIDLTGLAHSITDNEQATLFTSQGVIFVGDPGSVDFYYSVSGPSSFGDNGSSIGASTSSGNLVGALGLAGVIAVPAGYNSGSVLSDSATWDDATLAGFGLTPGESFEYTWDGGQNSVTVNVVSVPEPSQYGGAVLLAALAFVGWRRLRPAHGAVAKATL